MEVPLISPVNLHFVEEQIRELRAVVDLESLLEKHVETTSKGAFEAIFEFVFSINNYDY